MDGNSTPERPIKIRTQEQDAVGSLDSESSSELERLARRYADDFDLDHSDNDRTECEQDSSVTSHDTEVSLEELSRAFAKVVGANSSQSKGAFDAESNSHDFNEKSINSVAEGRSSTTQDSVPEMVQEGEPSDFHSDDEQFPVTPLAIVEAVLFLGRPDNGPITATEIAGLIRGVTDREVDELVEELNADYLANHRAFHIASIGGGYKMQLASDLEAVRQAFLGPARPVRLSQAAIDCLSLVSYQPGIRREKLDEQLGKQSGTILNQLVRRELLEIRREKVAGEKKLVPRYYPTQRMLKLAGLESLDDLPTAEEWVDRV